jgi:isopentenyldiphosphate isomerase
LELLDVVNESGEPTGETVDRETAHAEGIRHRTSHLWLLRKNEGNTEILLQKRAQTKSFPGCYDISSAGHIPAGDDYRESAVRELKEELGVTAGQSDLIFCGDKYIIWDDVFFGKPYHDRQYTRVFMLWADIDEAGFTLQEEEVDSVLWMDFEECIKGVEENSFLNCIDIEELMMVWRTSEDDRQVSAER